jgi:hypothetical protein
MHYLAKDLRYNVLIKKSDSRFRRLLSQSQCEESINFFNSPLQVFKATHFDQDLLQSQIVLKNINLTAMIAADGSIRQLSNSSISKSSMIPVKINGTVLLENNKKDD